MPPTGSSGDDVEFKLLVEKYIRENNVMIFSKSTCPQCAKVKDAFRTLNTPYIALELDDIENGSRIQGALGDLVGHKTVPMVFINGKHIGGVEAVMSLYEQGKLEEVIRSLSNGNNASLYEYDLVVIGGGSGGLAASKEAADLGRRVCVLDFVTPTPHGVFWNIGGTCVNVGCIPKKIMHQASLLGQAVQDAKDYGWQLDTDSMKHKWEVMKENVQNHIGSLNWSYRVQLRDRNITYLNSYGVFQDPHTLKCTNRRGKEQIVTGEKFIIATGLRPRYPDIPGAKEYGISSDDLFSLPYSPGKTLCVGASYVSLECAGFLHGMGFDVSVMVRSILLRGFDQDMAERIGKHMESLGIHFFREVVPTRLEQVKAGEPGLIRVYAKSQSTGEQIVGEYNTVLFAIGRDACTPGIGLDKAGVRMNPKNGKIPVMQEQTNVPHIYAVGDVIDGKLELTPVAIQAGRLLARRLYAGDKIQCDYNKVPTTVFTPLEYGCIGYAEEDAIQLFGEENIDVYHTHFKPLEEQMPHRDSKCYAKVICNKLDKERVIGFHVLGPNAGEITQGYAVAMRLGATKVDFDMTIGIHPTCSEVFTVLEVTKRSGKDVSSSSC